MTINNLNHQTQRIIESKILSTYFIIIPMK